MTIEAGTKVRITDDTSSHTFPIGTEGIVLRRDSAATYLVTTDPSVTEWESVSRSGGPRCRYVRECDLDVIVPFKAGDRVRITGNSNASHFKVGDLATLVRLESPNYWLATSDPAVTEWDYKSASNVKDDEIELVDGPQEGDRVKGHNLGGTTVYEGELQRKGYPFEMAGERAVRTDAGRVYYIEEATMELVVPSVEVTMEDVIRLTGEFNDADEAHGHAESSVDYYQELLDSHTADLEKAAALREEKFAALQAALTAYKG